ncbi:MAG TPA: cbb3-type cytochrome oxidase assembly protein CcoS [Candidatus Azoamicus sp.]
MDIIYILIPLSVLFLLVAILFFFWAVNSDQYENFESSSYHILLDDKKKHKTNDLT